MSIVSNHHISAIRISGGRCTPIDPISRTMLLDYVGLRESRHQSSLYIPPTHSLAFLLAYCTTRTMMGTMEWDWMKLNASPRIITHIHAYVRCDRPSKERFDIVGLIFLYNCQLPAFDRHLYAFGQSSD